MFTRAKNILYRWLRWSEKYFKTDMIYLVSRGFLSILGQGVTTLAVLVFAIVVGHYVPKEVYGEYKYVLAVIALLSLFSLNNIGGAVFQSTAQGYNGALSRGFWANIRWSFIVFCGALVMALYYFPHNPQLAAEILVGGCLSPFVTSATLYSSFLGGKKDFIRQSIYSVIDNVTTIGIMVITVLLTHNPLVLVAVYFASNALAALYFYRRTLTLYAGNEGNQDKRLLTYSKHLSAIGVLGGIADTLDQILVFHFAGAAQLAIFVFATALPDQARTQQKMLDTMLQASFVKRSAKEIKSTIGNKFFWYGVVVVCIIALYVIAAPYIFKIFFPNYMGSVFYSQIYVFSLLANILDPANTYLSSRRRVKEFYISGVFFSICQITTMVIGVIVWGVLGLVVAQVLNRIANATLFYFFYRRAIKQEISYA